MCIPSLMRTDTHEQASTNSKRNCKNKAGTKYVHPIDPHHFEFVSGRHDHQHGGAYERRYRHEVYPSATRTLSSPEYVPSPPRYCGDGFTAISSTMMTRRRRTADYTCTNTSRFARNFTCRNVQHTAYRIQDTLCSG